MALSLKTQNQPILATLLLWNFAVLYIALASNAPDWTQVSVLTAHWQQALLPAGVAVIAVGILTAQFNPEWKARIVFWKWRDPLPAARAFTVIGPSDPRIDMADLEKRRGPFPSAPAEQNRSWYKLYKTVESQPAILAPHKSYLLYRDYTCLSLLVLLCAAPLSVWRHLALGTVAILVVALLAQYLIARNAARLAGRRFVATVLANA